MKNVIFILTLILCFTLNNLLSQCSFTRVNTNDCLCITLLPVTNELAMSDRMSFELGGNSIDILGEQVVTNCYNQPGTYRVTRTVRMENGQNCTSQQDVVVAQCCPQLQNLNVQNASGNSSIQCTGGLISDENPISSSLVPLCGFIITPTLNVDLNSIPSSSFNWTVSRVSPHGSFVCSTSNVRTLLWTTTIGFIPSSYRISLDVNIPNCPPLHEERTINFTSSTEPCDAYTVTLKPTDNPSNEFILTKKNLIFPNPVSSLLKINNLPANTDIQEYIFEIQNYNRSNYFEKKY